MLLALRAEMRKVHRDNLITLPGTDADRLTSGENVLNDKKIKKTSEK